ncbi:hypothetical protein [Mitsuokella jalaludinii]|uniref:hypothetical protein n=1 Tax=Mitsuokella jalaludinii TaxID=187979 RepID=UPI003A8E0883
MFKIPKRCEYCAHKLVDGKCVNPSCIAYSAPETATETTETAETAKEGESK